MFAGNPDKVEWMRDGKVIRNSEDFAYEQVGDCYRLVIAEIFPEDGGVYTCQASNNSGKASSACSLFVQGNTKNQRLS